MGLCVFVFLTLYACNKETTPDNHPPVLKIKIQPPAGDSTITFVVDASRTTDREDALSFMRFRWDLNGDSIWDTDPDPSPYEVFRIPDIGMHQFGVTVQDRFGSSDSTWFSIETWGLNRDTSRMIDPRDYQEYRTVRIGRTWWMAENLNYGYLIPDTSGATDNGIPEKYCYLNDTAIILNPGGHLTYYVWEELMEYDTLNVTGLCPPGWQIPSRKDWQALRDSLGYRGYQTYLAGRGFSGLSLTYSGYHLLTQPWNPDSLNPDFNTSLFFSRDFSREVYGRRRQPCPWVADQTGLILLRFASKEAAFFKAALPVRCIKTDGYE